MASNIGFEGKRSNVSIEALERKSVGSKSSVNDSIRSGNDGRNVRRPKSSSASEVTSARKTLRVRPKTVDGNELRDRSKSRIAKLDPSKLKAKNPTVKFEKRKSETILKKKTGKENGQEYLRKKEKLGIKEIEGKKSYTRQVKGSFRNDNVQSTNSNSSSLSRESKKSLSSNKLKLQLKENPSEGNDSSKVSVKTNGKEEENDRREIEADKPESSKHGVKLNRGKKESKSDDKIKEALKEKFFTIIPTYESELQKIMDVWVNTIYCSLTMRAHLVKLLFQTFPNIDRSQFITEDEKILHCIANAKSYTKSEIEGLIQFVKSLLVNRERAKEQYRFIVANREVAEVYNYDWRKLTRKIAEVGEGARQLLLEVPELQKKRESAEAYHRDKIRSMEATLASKEEEIQKLTNQLNLLKQKESSYKANVMLKVQDFKDIKADLSSLRSAEKEYEELRAKFLSQTESYENSIKELEATLEDRIKVLEKEKSVKNRLRGFWERLQDQQKKLSLTMGKEQLDYVLGHSPSSKEKRRNQLWLAAAKLVIKGFQLQTKKLERDRNKMLLELYSADSENFNSIVRAIIRKENFIKSIKNQLNNFERESRSENKYKKENVRLAENT